MSLKNPVTPPGIDPGTVRLVVQHLNHYATPGPLLIKVCKIFPNPKVLNFRLVNDERNHSRNYRNISDDILPACMPLQSTAA
jgi:hypothetical protein